MQLTIDKLVYGGDGLARGPADDRGQGKAVFLPFVLAGERVEAEVVEQKPGFLRARPVTVLQASPGRVVPPCPYFGACGGCHYQHTGYASQLEVKRAILSETLHRIGQIEPPPIETHASPPWNYRNRTRMKARRGQEFALGYFRFGSHQLLPVEQCPISSPLINRAIQAIWRLGREGLVSDALAEIEFFANAADDELLLELTLPDQYWERASKPSLAEFVAAVRGAMPEIIGVAAFRSTAQGNLVREEVPAKLRDLFGAAQLIYNAGGIAYQVSAGSFFQTNRFLTEKLTALVVGGRKGKSALDLYAGTGLFTVPAAHAFGEVLAVEAAPFSYHDLKHNAPSNVKAYRETTEECLRRSQRKWTAPLDLVIVDPPRAGLGKAAAELAVLPTAAITYVSCDPATLARDLKVLMAAGFRIEQLHLIDLFPQTFHIEMVTQLVR